MTTVSVNRRKLEEQHRRIRQRRARLEQEEQRISNLLRKLKTGPRQRKSANANGRKRADKSSNVADTDALIRAVGNRDVRAVRRQLRVGADPNCRSEERMPLLLSAVYTPDNLPVVRALLRAGANVDAADDSGTTPLIASVSDSNLSLVKELVKRGANVNARNSDGDTPLTNAACWGSLRVVRYLLSHRADARITDGADVSAADLARQQGHLEIAKLIERALR